MSQKRKTISIIILLSIVLQLAAPFGEVVYAAKSRFNNNQVFYLPISDEEMEEEADLSVTSFGDEDNFVGEYEFKDDTVKVYMEPVQKYPIFGKAPIIFKLETQYYSTLTGVEYEIVLKDEFGNCITYDDIRIESYNYYTNETYILAYFEESYGDYEISLEAIDLETLSSFNTGFTPITLVWDDIVNIDEIIIDTKDLSLYVNNIAEYGELDAVVLDEEENVIYTTNDRFSNYDSMYEQRYYLPYPFSYQEEYYIYYGYVTLYKANETTTGTHTLLLYLDGEEIYEKEIEIVEKHPEINNVQIDKYLIAGDREFDIKVTGNYITKKDLLDVELIDSQGYTVATAKESHYSNVDIYGVYTEVSYSMEVLPDEEIIDDETYIIKLIYSGPEKLVVRTTNTIVNTITQTLVFEADTSQLNKGKVILNGVKFSSDDIYEAEVLCDGELLGEYLTDYISSRKLSLNLDTRLKNGIYSIFLYRIVNSGYYQGKEFVGSVYFYYYGQHEEPTEDTVLVYTNPGMISVNHKSYDGEIYIQNFVPDNTDDIEILLVDDDENIVGYADITGYSYSVKDSWIDFTMNITEELEAGEYSYIFKYEGTEIKDRYNDRITLYATDKATVYWVEIKGALYDEIISSLNGDIEFTLSNTMNINDLTKLDVYIEDFKGNVVAFLKPNTLMEVEGKGIQNYVGKLSLLDENIDVEAAYLFVTYEGQVICEQKVQITSKPHLRNLWFSNVISSFSKNMSITLNDALNINPDDLIIEIYDLDGKPVRISYEVVDQWQYKDILNYKVLINFNRDLKDAYYEIYIYYDGEDITKQIDSYYRGFYATKRLMLTGTTFGHTYENEDMTINLIDFVEAMNIGIGEEYIGHFYLMNNSSSYKEFIGVVDLISGEKYGTTGIVIPFEEFVDYPVGQYELIIVNDDGELLGRSYFSINFKEEKEVIPEDPSMRNPSFKINSNSNYTNSKEVKLNIYPDGYTLVKIANSKKELENAAFIKVQNYINWNLPDGDGEKTIYVQFSDEDGNVSEVLSGTIILDTTAPMIHEISLSKINDVVIGDIINISVTGNEIGNAFAVFYLNGVKVDSFSLDYIGSSQDLYKYSKSRKITKEIDKIAIFLEDLAGNKSSVEERNINMIKSENNSLTVFVKDINGNPQSDKYIYVYNYKENIYKYGYTDSEGKAYFDLPSNFEYEVSLYGDGYWDYRIIDLKESMEITFEIPIVRVITGKATINGQPVSDATIILTGNGQQYYGTTNMDGEYTISIYENTPSEYEISAYHSYYTALPNKVSQYTTQKDIQFYNKVKVYGTVRFENGEPVKNLYIYASGGYDWPTTYTNNNGEYELRLDAGEYYISHERIRNYETQYENITIDENELIKGAIKVDFVIKGIKYNSNFKGEGNNVKADATTIQIGKTFNLIVNFKNNGYTYASGKVAVDLPEGVKLVAGNTSTDFSNLAPGESGKIILTLEVTDKIREKKILIPAKITTDSNEYSLGFAELDVIDVTINAPSIVADGNFKVYGEATEGSSVSIIDRNTNMLIAVAKVTGKWYVANIVDLPEGEYQLFARAEKDGYIANSNTVGLKVDPDNGIEVKDIKAFTSGGNVIGMNQEIGVPAFSAWVDMNLNGNDIDMEVELNRYVDGMTAEFLFAGNVYKATYLNGKWEATLSNWSGSGTMQIKMRVYVGTLTYEFIVGEVIILIDPSGYVYDVNTGDRIEGAKVTLEKWNETTGNWEFWDAELYGQINPQLTDKDGKYGWMVGDGIYRVIVEKEGYEKAVVGDNKSIIIPPPRDNVNIGLKATTDEYLIIYDGEVKQAPTADYQWTIEFNLDVDEKSVDSNNVYVMDENGNKLSFISPKADGNKIILENKGRYTEGKTYTIVIKKTVKSTNGKSLNNGINMHFIVK